ncbi:MAG: hypothetical protein KDK07_25305 [Bauldia sp.]|nr:hypothetical protein [Bauldia sp.]
MPTQNSDINGNPFAITYAGPGLTWKVANGVDVTGTAAAIVSVFANSKLINKGSLFGGDYGVAWGPGGAFGTYTIDNMSSGEISGGIYGVYVSDFLGSLIVQNAGDIQGGTFGIYAVGSSDMRVDNTGEISGGTFALFLAASSAGGAGQVVNNHGMIESSQYGFYASGPSNVRVMLNNDKGALLKGGLAAITDLSPLTVKNDGKIEGLVETYSYDDKIINKGKIKGDVWLGKGLDVFKNKGKAKAGLIDSNEGNDKIVLGDKKDKLLFDSTLDSLTNVDTIKKFASGKDMMYLDDDIFTALTPGALPSSQFHIGTSASDADDFIIYDKASGALYYDPDGNGIQSQIQFAQFKPGTKIVASDFTVGEYSIPLV